MHKVERNKPPEGLDKKLIEFNKSLDNIQKNTIANSWTSFTRSKLKKQTLEQLNKMFKGCCAYCEGEYEDISYGEIEHFKPKSLYPELMFDYNNMNIACSKCNKNKGEKFDEKLINPTIDNPEEYLKFDEYMLTALDERGTVTINILDINNKGRIKKKIEGYNAVRDRIKFVNMEIEKLEKGNKNARKIIKDIIVHTIKEIEEMFEEGFEFCTMYRHNFQKDIEYLKKKIKEL